MCDPLEAILFSLGFSVTSNSDFRLGLLPQRLRSSMIFCKKQQNDSNPWSDFRLGFFPPDWCYSTRFSRRGLFILFVTCFAATHVKNLSGGAFFELRPCCCSSCCCCCLCLFAAVIYVVDLNLIAARRWLWSFSSRAFAVPWNLDIFFSKPHSEMLEARWFIHQQKARYYRPPPPSEDMVSNSKSWSSTGAEG